MDTWDVGGETRPIVGFVNNAHADDSADPSSPNSVAHADETDRGLPSVGVGAHVAGFAGKRFVVIDTDERTVVFDVETSHAFGVFGHPVTEQSFSAGWDVWQQASTMPPTVASKVIASDDGNVLVIRTEHGLQAVDLTNKGALLTGWRGQAKGGASIAPDGSAFAAIGDGFVDIVRTADGTHARFDLSSTSSSTSGSPPTIGWRANTAYFADGDSARVVQYSGSFRTLNVTMPDAHIAASKDGATFVVWHPGATTGRADGSKGVAAPGALEVWHMGESKPRAHIASAFVGQVTLDDDDSASHIAWSEYSGESDAKTFLHLLDTSSNAHIRFASKSPHCSIAEERIVGFEAGALKTDGECSPGCPSIASQAEFITYDITTGAKTREWKGELFEPFNNELGDRVSKVEKIAKRVGVKRIDSTGAVSEDMGTFPLIHHPKDDTMLAKTSSNADARLVNDDTAAVITTIESSAAFGIDRMVFTPAGTRLIGIAGTEIAVWDTETGKRLWSWR